MEISKKDWKLFNEKLPGWQEAYMGRLCGEYAQILTGEGDAADRFWALEKRIREDRRKPGVVIEKSKESMIWDIAALIRDGAVSTEDLSDFSDNLRDAVSSILGR